MKPFLYFISIPLIFAISQNILDNCQPGNEFVEKYIKYRCYEENEVKGARVIGCAPSNDMTGITLGAWETYDEKWFKYHCVIDRDSATYSVKACLDPLGGLLPVGKSRSFPEGETFTCFFEDNKIKLNHQTSQGCVVGKQVYGDGASWTEKSEDIMIVGSEKKIIGQGTAFYCRKYSNGTFKAEFAACLTSQNTYVRPDSYSTFDGEIIKCDSSSGKCILRRANLTETRCLFEDISYRHDEEWVSEDRKTAYVCQFGQVVKKGCLVGSLLIPLHTIRYADNVPFYCHLETRLLSFGNIKGCKTPDKNIIEFEKTYKNGDKVEKCGFKFASNGSIIYQWNQIGCAFSKDVITINGIQQIGDKYVHCALNGKSGYMIKIMTRVEIEQWLVKTGQRWSNIMLGKEGEGATIKQNFKTRPIPISTTTQAITTTTSPLPMPTIKPETKPKCIDNISDCKHLLAYCKSGEEYLEDIKHVITKASISLNNREKMLEYINLITSPNSIKYNGIKAKGQKTENCQKCTESCSKNCQCRQNMEFSRKLVRSLCPKSCELCDEKSSSVADILKSETSLTCHNQGCIDNYI